jgi:hypothetical protein
VAQVANSIINEPGVYAMAGSTESTMVLSRSVPPFV